MMKVKISFTVEVDQESWEHTYGVVGAADVRTDVKEWAYHLVHGALDENGCNTPWPAGPREGVAH